MEEGFVLSDRAIGGTCSGNLHVSATVIGGGSNGTMVYDGFYYDQPVAVKRFLRGFYTVAFNEISHMIEHERHPNIVRYWGLNFDVDFMYLGLERCTCSLNDLIEALSDEDQPFEKLRDLRYKMQDVDLSTSDGRPSPLLLKLMREVVLGLGQLHELEIVHRDLKPQNIFITGEPLVAKLSDVGIIKRLVRDRSVVLPNHRLVCRADAYGSSGWRAPELLIHGGHPTPETDMFSLGCVLFYCITRGGHPFGERPERDYNIETNAMDLSSVEFIPEAHDLISRLLNADPKLRPQPSEVLQHPFFWSSETRLSFLCDVSDRLELEAGAPNSHLLKELENTAPVVFGVSWDLKIEIKVMANLRRHGTYDGRCVADLLRAVRENFSHHVKASKRVKEILGSVPDGLDAYFTKRFPALLMECYRVLSQFWKKEEGFREYFLSLGSAKKGIAFRSLNKKKRCLWAQSCPGAFPRKPSLYRTGKPTQPIIDQPRPCSDPAMPKWSREAGGGLRTGRGRVAMRLER